MLCLYFSTSLSPSHSRFICTHILIAAKNYSMSALFVPHIKGIVWKKEITAERIRTWKVINSYHCCYFLEWHSLHFVCFLSVCSAMSSFFSVCDVRWLVSMNMWCGFLYLFFFALGGGFTEIYFCFKSLKSLKKELYFKVNQWNSSRWCYSFTRNQCHSQSQ